jgi:hypothetical protein
MRATHKLTHLPDGDVCLFEVRGDTYKWQNQRTGRGEDFFSIDFGYYIENDHLWKVEKINTFKGNK